VKKSGDFIVPTVPAEKAGLEMIVQKQKTYLEEVQTTNHAE
jgi:hypothetical protein